MIQRAFARGLLASAAVAAAITLAGCDTDGLAPTGRSQAPISEKMLSEIESKQMNKESPILVRLFKEEAELEVWKKNREGKYALLKTYPICRWSGDLGPKIKEGDRQAPEGFYTITPGHMNPNSNFYLAFNMGYPNSFDRAHGRTGSELMVHGDCSSRGCYAMTDEQMVEIYALARESFFGGQKAFQVQAYPFRMTPINMARHRTSKHYAFWKMIKTGHDHFEITGQEPKVDVCDKRYVFDAVDPSNASRPLAFNPRGKCPVFTIPSDVAEAINDKKRRDEIRIADYIARGTPTVGDQRGTDGGMNPVFLSKVASLDVSGPSAPGALPRTPGPPAPALTLASIRRAQLAKQAQEAPAAPEVQETEAPVVLANVPVPAPAPLAKEGEAPRERPTTLAGLIGNIFGGDSTENSTRPQTIAPESVSTPQPVPVPAEAAPRPAVIRTASATPAPVAAAPKPPEAAPAPRVIASAAPEQKPRVLDPVRTTGRAMPPPEPRQPEAAPPPPPPIQVARREPEPRWPEAAPPPPRPVMAARREPEPARPPATPPARQVAAKPVQLAPPPRAVEPPKAVARAVPPPAPKAEPRQAAEPPPRAVARATRPVELKPEPRRAVAARQEPSPLQAPSLTTAYAAPPASKAGLLSGAQPVMPVGAFASR